MFADDDKIITRILSGEEAVEEGAGIIKSGGIVAFPTETVYGLGANAYSKSAVNKIFIAKGRPQDNPLIVHISDIKDIYNIATDINDNTIILMEKFMPGPLTLVLKKNGLIPEIVSAGLDTVGVRMPSHPVARQLISRAGVPIAAPSANVSSHISPTSAKHVYDDLNGRIPLIIDGGECEVGIESTVLDMTGEITVLRPGVVTKDMIEDALKQKIGVKYNDSRPASPGMKYRHYAPEIPVEIINNESEIAAKYDNLVKNGINPVILTFNNNYGERLTINLGNNLSEVAKNIYAALRRSEKAYDYIICENFDDNAVGHSIMNRIIKAAEVKKP